MSAAVGPTETNKGTGWSNRILGEYFPYLKKRTRYIMIISCLWGLQRTSTKIGKIFNLYQRELIKRTILYMFCAVCSPRKNASFSATQHFSKQKTNTYCLCSTACVCVPLRAEKATSAVFQLQLFLLIWRIW